MDGALVKLVNTVARKNMEAQSPKCTLLRYTLQRQLTQNLQVYIHGLKPAQAAPKKPKMKRALVPAPPKLVRSISIDILSASHDHEAACTSGSKRSFDDSDLPTTKRASHGDSSTGNTFYTGPVMVSCGGQTFSTMMVPMPLAAR
eukprot:m.223642 g.223642  ORF g.223642 m.223642 type:complete len:145 (+) comp10956_c0_seq1:38-472(+)